LGIVLHQEKSICRHQLQQEQRLMSAPEAKSFKEDSDKRFWLQIQRVINESRLCHNVNECFWRFPSPVDSTGEHSHFFSPGV
jgi:hypothetical protein